MCAGYPKDNIDAVPGETLHDELTTRHLGEPSDWKSCSTAFYQFPAYPMEYAPFFTDKYS